jgi:hypothetical protein
MIRQLSGGPDSLTPEQQTCEKTFINFCHFPAIIMIVEVTSVSLILLMVAYTPLTHPFLAFQLKRCEETFNSVSHFPSSIVVASQCVQNFLGGSLPTPQTPHFYKHKSNFHLFSSSF